MHYIPLFCTNSPCNLLFFNLGVYRLVQATVGIGIVLIWDLYVAYTRGLGTFNFPEPYRTVPCKYIQHKSKKKLGGSAKQRSCFWLFSPSSMGVVLHVGLYVM